MRNDDAKQGAAAAPRERDGGAGRGKKPYKKPRLEKYEELHKIGVGYA